MIKSWMIIGSVTLLVSLVGGFLTRLRDIPWGKRLDRPNWLFFEPAIPAIWTIIFICGAWSATLAWQKDPGSLRTWLLMGLYLLVQTVTVAYILAALRSRSLAVGKILAGLGVVLGVLLH